MPTYDYACGSCDYRFEKFQSMSAEPLLDCPNCDRAELRRLIGGGVGIIFRGSGFYVNDSRATQKTAKSTSQPAATGTTEATQATAVRAEKNDASKSRDPAKDVVGSK